ncbi:hypothetical protein FC777_00525 [Clostridium botulinum]|nr:hypothetical protein [Clostridium botulinum]
MKLTSNYSLKKPEGSDVVNVQDFNDNSDKIDLELKKVDSSLKDIANKVDNIKIADGTTTTKGIVKLNTAINSTSTTEATTPSATKQAYDKGVEALNRANEAFTSASNGKTYIAGKVGNVTGSNTFTQIGDRIQTDKNTAATNLNSKGISSSGNETLDSLASKIAQISVQGMGGRRFVSGITTSLGGMVSSSQKKFERVDYNFNVTGGTSYIDYVMLQLNFTPKNAFFWGSKDNAAIYTIMVNGLFCTTSRAYDDSYEYRLYKPIIEGNTLILPCYTWKVSLNYIIFE